MKRNNHGSAAVVIFVVAILVAVGLTGVLVVSGTLSKINRTSGVSDVVAASDETFERDTSAADTIEAQSVDFNDANIKAMQDDDVKNILLIGQDRREGQERQRSDSMILCSINTKSKKIILTSLMRDMYVEIPGYSPNKMNAAYAFGGMDLLNEVVEKNFGITIDGNVEVDFDGFLNAITVIGDIPMELTVEEADYLNTNPGLGTDNDGSSGAESGWNLKEGMNELDPAQTLAFSRIRYPATPTGREPRDCAA